MASPHALTQLTFAGGIDETIRAEAVDPTASFLVIENVRQKHIGAASKRYGFDAGVLMRNDGTSRSAGYKLLSFGEQQCAIDGTTIDVWDTIASKWVSRGRVPECGYDTTFIPAFGSTATSYLSDVELCNGYLCVVGFAYSGTPAASVVNAATGALVAGPTLIAVGDYVSVASLSSRYFIAFIEKDSTTSIKAYLFDTTAPASGWSLLATVTSSLDVPHYQRFSVCSLEDRVAIAYITGSGTDRVSVKTYNQLGLLESTTIGTSSTTPDAVDIAGSNADTLWVAWNEATLAKVIGLTGNSLATVKATAATIVTVTGITTQLRIAPGATGGGRMAALDGTPEALMLQSFTTTAGAAVTSGSGGTIYNCAVRGRPFYRSGRFYVIADQITDFSLATQQRMAILVDWTEDDIFVRPVANIAPFLAVPSSACKVVGSSNDWYTGVNIVRSSVAYAFAYVHFDFADTRRWQSVEHNGVLYLTGAVTSYFDGRQVSEACVIPRPQKPTTSTGGTGITLTVGRTYVAVFETLDASGNWIQGSISDPSASTGAVTNKTITISVSTLSISSNATNENTRIAVYGTTDGGTTYYRIGSAYNNAASSTTSIADANDDTTLLSFAELYSGALPSTPGDSLDRRAPPGLMHLETYNGMLVGATDTTLFWSGQQVIGEGTWFNPDFQQPVPDTITGIKAQDGSLYVWTRRSVYATSGDAPSDNGSSGGLGTIRRIAADIGCVDARSLVSTALGTFFQSDRGIELLTRAQEVQWIGEQVRDTVAAFPVCTSARLDADAQRVVFELAASESANQVSGSGRTLVYHLKAQIWESVDRRTNNAGTADTPAQSAAVVYTGSAWRYAWLGTDGRVYTEDPTTYLDPGSRWVTKKVQTAHVKAGGIQGRQHVNRILWLAKKQTNCDQAMALTYDYGSAQTARTWTATEVASIAGSLPNLQVQHDGNDSAEFCEGISVTMTDATPSTGEGVTTGEGATWLAVLFDVTPQDGGYLLPDACR